MDINSDTIKAYISDEKNKYLIITILVILFMVIFFFVKISEPITDYFATQSENEKILKELTQLEKQATLIKERKENDVNNLNSLKPIYKATSTAQDISIFAGMIESIVEVGKANNIKIRSIEYTLNPENEVLTSSFSEEYSACVLRLYTVSKYYQLQAFLKELITTYPNFVNLWKVEVEPYQANKDFLLTNIAIILYIEKAKEPNVKDISI